MRLGLGRTQNSDLESLGGEEEEPENARMSRFSDLDENGFKSLNLVLWIKCDAISAMWSSWSWSDHVYILGLPQMNILLIKKRTFVLFQPFLTSNIFCVFSGYFVNK